MLPMMSSPAGRCLSMSQGEIRKLWVSSSETSQEKCVEDQSGNDFSKKQVVQDSEVSLSSIGVSTPTWIIVLPCNAMASMRFLCCPQSYVDSYFVYPYDIRIQCNIFLLFQYISVFYVCSKSPSYFPHNGAPLGYQPTLAVHHTLCASSIEPRPCKAFSFETQLDVENGRLMKQI